MTEKAFTPILDHAEGQTEKGWVKFWIILSMCPYIAASGIVTAFIWTAGSGTLTTLFTTQFARFAAVAVWTAVMAPFIWRGGQIGNPNAGDNEPLKKKTSAVQFGHKRSVRYIVTGVFMIVMGILMYASPLLPLLYIGESRASEFLGGKTDGVGYTMDMNTMFIVITGLCSYGIGFGVAIMCYGIALGLKGGDFKKQTG